MTIFRSQVQVVSPYRRITRMVGYLCMPVFGLIVIFFPNPLASNVVEATIITFGVCLVSGGLLSAIAQWTRRYWGEVVGMPLLISSFLFYAAESFTNVDRHHLSRLGFGWACVGISLFLTGRWQDVLFIRRLAEELGKRGEGLGPPGE
jgi:hypothetical protein